MLSARLRRQCRAMGRVRMDDEAVTTNIDYRPHRVRRQGKILQQAINCNSKPLHSNSPGRMLIIDKDYGPNRTAH